MIRVAKSLQKSTLHEQTYHVLRDNILSGELAPGDRLIESQLAEQLQVSRTPIREAIRQLQQEELVTTDGLGCLRIATVSDVDAQHLYDCRIALETLAIEGACCNAQDPQLQALRKLVEQAETITQQGVSKARSAELLEIDFQFHRTIAQSSGNAYLTSLLEQVFNKMALLRSQTTLHNPMVLDIRSEHQKIYEAIARRDVKAAKHEIQSHLKASKVRVLKELISLRE